MKDLGFRIKVFFSVVGCFKDMMGLGFRII